MNLMKQNLCSKLKTDSHILTSHETKIPFLLLLDFQRYKLKQVQFREQDAKNLKQQSEHF